MADIVCHCLRGHGELPDIVQAGVENVWAGVRQWADLKLSERRFSDFYKRYSLGDQLS